MKRLAVLLITFVATLTLAQSNPAPFVNQLLVPESAKPGSGAFALTVNGTGFVSNSIVYWNGSARSTQFISSSQLTATISTADVAKAATASVTVVSPPPGGGSSNAVDFVIRNASTQVPWAPDLAARLEPGAVAVADFNGDGKLDVAIGWWDGAYKSGGVDVYLGNGDGTFARKPIRTEVFVQQWTVSAWLQVADFNADGKPDIAFNSFDGDGNNPAGGVILLGNGDGTFTVTNNSYALASPAVGDINGDGLPDFVTTGGAAAWDGQCGTKVYLAKAGGTYTISAGFGQGCANAGYGEGAALGDFNHDGKLDVAVVCAAFGKSQGSCVPSGAGVLVALGNGDGTFQAPVYYGTANGASAITAADLNGDGNLDLVTDGVCTLLGNGDGTFKPATCSSPVNTAGTMVLGDFNGDGKLDVALLSNSSSSYDINVYLGKGDGTFANPLVYSAPAGAGVSLAAGDFNGDGRTDLVVGSADGVTNAVVFLQTVASVSPTSLAFGNEPVGKKSPTQTVTFTNDKSSTLKITSVGIIGKNSNDFQQTNNCGPTVPAGGSCRIKVVFKPNARGAASADLVVRYEGTGGPQTAPLSGTGT
jgi:hypothetical protein